MSGRHRSRPNSVRSKRWYQHRATGAVIAYNEVVTNFIDEVDDVVAQGDCHAFLRRYERPSELCWNGHGNSGIGQYDVYCDNYFPQGIVTYLNQAKNALLVNKPPDGVLAAKLGNRTNPSRPDVDIPAFIGELKELPRLIQVQGRKALEKAASANLNVQLGWAPFIGDLNDLSNLAASVSRRTAELEKLYKSGFRRTVSLWTGSASPLIWTNVQLSNDAGLSSARFHVTATRTCSIRGHARWKPLTGPPSSQSKMIAQAVSAVTALSKSKRTNLASAWELVPFSFLADYFSSIGDYLGPKRNSVPAFMDKCVLMETNTIEVKIHPVVPPPQGISTGQGRYTFVTKERRAASPTIEAYMPVLTGRQQSIVGSLAVLSSKGRYR